MAGHIDLDKLAQIRDELKENVNGKDGRLLRWYESCLYFSINTYIEEVEKAENAEVFANG